MAKNKATEEAAAKATEEAAAKAAEEAAAKAAEEAADDGLVEITDGVDTLYSHPDQLAHWAKQGYYPAAEAEEA